MYIKHPLNFRAIWRSLFLANLIWNNNKSTCKLSLRKLHGKMTPYFQKQFPMCFYLARFLNLASKFHLYWKFLPLWGIFQHVSRLFMTSYYKIVFVVKKKKKKCTLFWGVYFKKCVSGNSIICFLIIMYFCFNLVFIKQP